LPAEHARDDLELAAHADRVGLGEDRADRGSDHVRVPGGYHGEQAAAEVDPAALRAGVKQGGGDGGFQAGVRVGDHQLNPVQATGFQATQERGPERPGLAVSDVEAEHLAPPVRADPGRDHDRLGGHPAAPAAPVTAAADRAEAGVQEHVGKLDLDQRAVSETRHADPEVAHRVVPPVVAAAAAAHRSGAGRGVMEAYVTGTSTRKVDDLVVAMGADTGISKREVSRICADLDLAVQRLQPRS
jgi:hypothetical protein